MMTPVSQTKLYSDTGSHHGNCFAAVLASLLDIPLWMVPEFEGMFARRNKDWLERVDEWLNTMFGKDLNYDSPKHITDGCVSLPEFYIVGGQSSRGVEHAVIFSDGKMVHDPHPLGGGISKITRIYWIGQDAVRANRLAS
jgi:hypothetical protein